MDFKVGGGLHHLRRWISKSVAVTTTYVDGFQSRWAAILQPKDKSAYSPIPSKIVCCYTESDPTCTLIRMRQMDLEGRGFTR